MTSLIVSVLRTRCRFSHAFIHALRDNEFNDITKHPQIYNTSVCVCVCDRRVYFADKRNTHVPFMLYLLYTAQHSVVAIVVVVVSQLVVLLPE